MFTVLFLTFENYSLTSSREFLFIHALTNVSQIFLLVLLMQEMCQNVVRLKDLKVKKFFKHFLRVQCVCFLFRGLKRMRGSKRRTSGAQASPSVSHVAWVGEVCLSFEYPYPGSRSCQRGPVQNSRRCSVLDLSHGTHVIFRHPFRGIRTSQNSKYSDFVILADERMASFFFFFFFLHFPDTS